LIANQTPALITTAMLHALALPPDRFVETYPRLGHVGGADLFLGLEAAARSNRPRKGTTLLMASTAFSLHRDAVDLLRRRRDRGQPNNGLSLARLTLPREFLGIALTIRSAPDICTLPAAPWRA